MWDRHFAFWVYPEKINVLSHDGFTGTPWKRTNAIDLLSRLFHGARGLVVLRNQE